MDRMQQISREMFRDSVAIWRDPEHCIPFMKGRVALYAILRALGIGEGDEVLVPGFTCVVVPAAICYTGAKPVYYDIDSVTLQGDPQSASDLVSERTTAVLIQHNFGAVASLGHLPDVCRERGIAIIEDCAHSLGAIVDGRPVGTLGTAAFCSLQWSKPTTTGLGGIARFGDKDQANLAKDLTSREFHDPGVLRSGYLALLSEIYRRWYRPTWYWTAQSAYRRASEFGLIQGSSSAAELHSLQMPGGYCGRFGRLRERSLDAALENLPTHILHRRSIHAHYARCLASLKAWLPPADRVGTTGVALRFPLLIENRPEFLKLAKAARVEIGDWFNSPLHPGCATESLFSYVSGTCPAAEAAAASVINLPTHKGVRESDAESIVSFVLQHATFRPVRWSP